MSEDKDKKYNDNEDFEILPDDYQIHDISFKLIVIGDSGVGKSCLTMKATKNIFENYYSPTIGFEFCTFVIRIKDKIVRLQIWDTCGQEVYRSLINGFYHNSSLAILVYSIDKIQSFKNLETWLNDIKINSSPDIKIFLIGNKKDLEEKREVPNDKAKNFYKEHGLYKFMEASAKTGLNAQKIFIDAARVLLEENEKAKEKLNKEKNKKDNINEIKKIKLNLEDDSINDSNEQDRNKRNNCC